MTRLNIVGRERRLANDLTNLILRTVQRHHSWKPIRETKYGCTFDVALQEKDGTFANRVARVTVEMLPPDQTDLSDLGLFPRTS